MVTEFFSVAGFGVKLGQGLLTADQVVQAVVDSRSRIVVICSADEAYPGLAEDYVGRLYEYIPGSNHRSVQRCFMRTLSRYPLTSDEELLGVYYDFCFKLITDQSAPVAVRYYGMYFSYQTCLLEPDLKFELLPLLDEVVKHDSSGMKVRAKMFRSDIIKKYGNLNEV